MSKANDTHSCTCPSGDGSLRWPCPVHPQEAQSPAAPDVMKLRAEVLEHASKGSRLVRTLFNEPTGTLSDVEVGDWIQRAQQYLALTTQAAPATLPDVDRDGMTLIVDAAMRATANISPPLRRSDCQRVINAALPLIPLAPQAQPADALEPVRQAVRDYHYSLDTRQHGGVAADAAINAIERALGMRWQQGQEAGRRNAVAPAQSKGE